MIADASNPISAPEFRYRPSATILFTTKNRREDLRRALLSAVGQIGTPIETLVIDDGSTDNTDEMVRSEFPSTRLVRHDKSLGYIVRRNEGAKLAQAPIVFSLDDDAVFSSPNIVAETLAQFNDPRVGAVAIPFVNVLQGPRTFQRSPGGIDEVYVADTYIGTAHALQREQFLALGSYREHLIHQGEESDYCIRLLAAGGVVRLGNSAPIHHYESPKRDLRRMDYHGRRNDLLFVWHNVPLPEFFVHFIATILNGLRAAITRADHPAYMVRGMLAGLIGCLRYWRERRPVRRAVYWLQRSLKKGGPRTLRELESLLPSLSPNAKDLKQVDFARLPVPSQTK